MYAGRVNSRSGRDDQAGMHEYTGQSGRGQPIGGLRCEPRQLQTEWQANWARGRKVKPDQDQMYRSTGDPYASVFKYSAKLCRVPSCNCSLRLIYLFVWMFLIIPSLLFLCFFF